MTRCVALLAALVMTVGACSASIPAPTTAPSPIPSGVATPSSTTLVVGSASARPTPTAPLPASDHFGLVIDRGCSPPGPAPYLRAQDRSDVIVRLGQGYLCQFQGSVSPDGRRIAYPVFEPNGNGLALWETGATTSKTLVSLGAEASGTPVWSSDGTALVFVATKGGGQGVVPDYSALRTFDLATGKLAEILRTPERFLSPLAWDRRAHVIALISSAQLAGVVQPFGGEYQVIAQDGVCLPIDPCITRNSLPPNTYVTASIDATWAVGVTQAEHVVRYWPLAAYADRKAMAPSTGTDFGGYAWRPGAQEFAMYVVSAAAPPRVELWGIDGSRRTLVDNFNLSGGGFFWQPDGTVLFYGCCTAIEVASGRVVTFTLGEGERIKAAAVIR